MNNLNRNNQPTKYNGEKLVLGNKILLPARTENIARFKFFSEQARGACILDMGCGIGEGAIYLSAQTGWKIFGVDVSYSALSTASSLSKCEGTTFIQMNVEKLAFKSKVFDSIISVEVIEHLQDPRSYLSEAHRVLRNGGVFILTTPNKLISSPHPGTLWPEHLREYEPKHLKHLLLSTFSNVELWGESIPIYENHPFRKLIRSLAPLIKPMLPHWIRIRGLHILYTAIKPELKIEDVVFTRENIEKSPTLVAICRL